MTELDFAFLKQLTEAFGPSGAEDSVREIIANKISPFVSRLRRDPLGNLIAEKGDGGNMVISSHMDEVGFMVTAIQNDGTLRFSPVGGIVPASLPAKRVYFTERNLTGVIGCKPVHLEKEGSPGKSYSDLYMDIGADSKKGAEKLVSLGDLAVFSTETEYLSPDGKTVKGKAMDDRLGCFLLCRLILDPEITNCTFLFSVQEESGLLGASAFARGADLDWGIALDVTTPNDLPNVKGPETVCELGAGPVISYADGRSIYDSSLISKIFEKLEHDGVEHQTKAVRAGGNEAFSFRSAGRGMKNISISVPCRYIHSPVGIVQESDIEATEKALRLIISQIQGGGFSE